MINENEYDVGQSVWLYLSNHKGKTTEGKIVHKFTTDYGRVIYVIEFETHIDPFYEARDWFTLSPAADKPINMYTFYKKQRICSSTE